MPPKKARYRKPASRAKNAGGGSMGASAPQEQQECGNPGSDAAATPGVNDDQRIQEQDDDQALETARDAILNNPELHKFPTNVNTLQLDDAAMHQSNALSPVDEDDGVGSDEEDTWQWTPGPLSKEAQQAAQELAKLVVMQSERIARKYGKSRREIMLAAGLTTRSARAPNNFNLYKRWYSHEYPLKPKTMSFPEYSKHVATVYRENILSIEDLELRAAAMKPIFDFINSQDSVTDPNKDSLRSVVSIMGAAKDQFTNLAAAYHNIEEVEVVGVIIYTGMDAAARQTSTLFGGSTLIQKAMSDSRSDVRKILDRITTDIKYAEAKKKGTDTSALDVERKYNETDRDRDRRVFTSMMHKSLSLFQGVRQTLSWKRWAQMAIETELRIVNWPADVKPPGPDFDLKLLTTSALRTLVGEYISCTLKGNSFPDAPGFEKWTEDEIAIPLDHIKKGEIAIVVSQDGSPLQTLAQTHAWRKQFEKAHKSRNIRRRVGRVVVRGHDFDDENARRPSAGRKPTKKGTSNYKELSESDTDELPHRDSSHKRLHSRHDPDCNSDDNRRARKRKREEKMIMEQSSDNNGSEAGMKKNHRYPEGRVKGKSHHSRNAKVAGPVQGKGKMKAVHVSESDDLDKDRSSDSDQSELEED